jgi:tetratricopeptide (TPR) repeat protein
MTALGSLLVQKGSFAEAETVLKKVIELEPQNPPALTAMIDLKLRTKAPPSVLNYLLAQISALTAKANPTVSLWTARAALENALAKPDAAKKSLSAALALDAKNRNALLQLADIAVAEGDVVKAKDLAARLEQIAAGNDSVNLLKAHIAAQEGRFADAIKSLDEIKDPPSAAVELRGKITAMRSGNTADLEKQLEADPKNAGILGRLCTLYRRDDPAKALEMCRRASEAEPSNINHAVGFGAALVQAKQFDAAVNLFRKILEITPDNATAHANLATALFQLKRMPEAKAEFLWLTNAQPASAGAYLFLGIIHDQLDEFVDAMASYQQYLRLADPVENKLDIDKVNLRIPAVQKLIKAGKGKN